MDFGSIAIGTRRSSTISSLGLSGSNVPANASNGRRRSSVLSLSVSDARRKSSAINLNFENRKNSTRLVDEPILLCKHNDEYLFFSMSSDGTLNYKVASRVEGSMSTYLVDPSRFNTQKGPVIVLSSPSSGAGLALQTYTRLLLPILKHFKIAHSHIELKDPSTAGYLAANGQFTSDTIFILLSGDGVINEIINGLSVNPHFEATGSAIKICPVPNGSGNGLANSLKITSIAQGLRAIFRDNFTPLPVISVEIGSRCEMIYSAVVVSYGLHAVLIKECADPATKAKYGNNRFQEVAKTLLNPKPYLYQADLKLLRASRFPDFNGPQFDLTVGNGEHTYCLFTRCANLESDWKIAPLANPLASGSQLDVVRMGNLGASDLTGVLMDAYKSGAQTNRRDFEYFRSSYVTLNITEEDPAHRVLCVDGMILDLLPHDTVKLAVTNSIGKMATTIQVQKL